MKTVVIEIRNSMARLYSRLDIAKKKKELVNLKVELKKLHESSSERQRDGKYEKWSIEWEGPTWNIITSRRKEYRGWGLAI